MQTDLGKLFNRAQWHFIISLITITVVLGCNATNPKYAVLDRDLDNHKITIEFPSDVTYATDSDCLEAARIIHGLCSEGYEVTVVGWCPSAKNPITLEWAEELLDADGKPVPIKDGESD